MANYDEFVLNLLLEQGKLTPEQVAKARRDAGSSREGSVHAALVEQRLVTPRELAIARAVVCEVPFVGLDLYEIDVQNAALLPRTLAEAVRACVLFVMGRSVVVGMVDPLDLSAIDRLRAALKMDIDPVLCEPAELSALIDRAYSLAGARSVGPATVEASRPVAQRTAEEEPIIAAVNQIITQAASEGASDVHINPDENELTLRFRIDGQLAVRQGPSFANHPAIVQRIKVMANLDLTQTRRPQDGKFRFPCAGRLLDVRVSIIPTICGENVVMRLLNSGGALLDVEELGFAPAVAEAFITAVEHAHGMMLVTGPTGSGKTTTLYTALKRLNKPQRHCVTIEDPVEIRLPLVRHVQVNTEIGLTFATALRSILRQDPDVILLGEIRDEETARIAVQAALTGHMVLSTLHTNDAPGAIARLIDFKCPSFAINAALTAVLAQRLVRRVCPDCAAPVDPEASLSERFGCNAATSQFRSGPGCQRCAGQGYRGRLGVYELMAIDGPMRVAIEHGSSSADLRKLAIARGMIPLWRDGVNKAMIGQTTLEEVARVAAGMELEDGLEFAPTDAKNLRMSA